MADKTKIEWTEATWNPIRGCSVVSEGCRNCYAMQVAARFAGKDLPYEGLAYRNSSGAHWTGQVKLIEKHLEDPLRWQRPRRIFVNSMSDLFHATVSDEWIDRIFAVMALSPQHTFQVLTKRPRRMLEYLTTPGRHNEIELAADRVRPGAGHPSFGGKHLLPPLPLPNVWLGVSCEDQRTADERIPLLLETPAAVRWISAEPLLGPINARAWHCACGWKGSESTLLPSASSSLVCPKCGASGGLLYANWLSSETYQRKGIDWVVAGGESGPGARPMKPEWARSLRDQCDRASVPFFFKQWGEWAPNWLNDPKTGEKIPHSEWMDRVGKKTAGRTLDGREWSEYPKEVPA